MKILHFISSSGFFGAENVVITLAKEQRRQGVEVVIGVFMEKSHSASDIAFRAKKEGIPLKEFVCEGKFDFKTILAIRRVVTQYKIDVIHSHNYKSNFYVLLASFGLKINKVTTCHNWRSYGIKMKAYELLDKVLLNRFDAIVCVSKDLLKEVKAIIRMPDKVCFIGNGVDTSNFQVEKTVKCKALLRHYFNINENDKLVGIIGRLTEEKGHIYLLKAFAKVSHKFSKVKLMIVGDGPLKNSLQSTVDSLQIESKVIFTGIRDDIPELLDLMDIFVLPSLDEGMPMAVLEAMAARKPIITSGVGAIANLIENEKEGLIISPGNTEEIADMLIELFNDEKKAKELADNACKKVFSKFSAENMAKQYSRIYEKLLFVTD